MFTVKALLTERKEDPIMSSDLTKQIEQLNFKLRKSDDFHRTKSYDAVLDLTSLVLELSRKVDRQEEK